MSAEAMRDDGLFEGVANYRREKTLAIVLPSLTFQMQRAPNKALQLTANPLRGLSAAELGR